MMIESEMIKDGFWHEYQEGNEVAWRMYQWDELRGCFIFRSMPTY